MSYLFRCVFRQAVSLGQWLKYLCIFVNQGFKFFYYSGAFFEQFLYLIFNIGILLFTHGQVTDHV